MARKYKKIKYAKPCYVCGCEDVCCEWDNDADAYRMFCTACGAYTNWRQSGEVALSSWNGRAIDTFHADEVLADYAIYGRLNDCGD